jgi:hypothetical protein
MMGNFEQKVQLKPNQVFLGHRDRQLQSQQIDWVLPQGEVREGA